MGEDERTRKRALKALLVVWVTDLVSEPDPAMPELEAALARCRAGGAA